MDLLGSSGPGWLTWSLQSARGSVETETGWPSLICLRVVRLVQVARLGWLTSATCFSTWFPSSKRLACFFMWLTWGCKEQKEKTSSNEQAPFKPLLCPVCLYAIESCKTHAQASEPVFIRTSLLQPWVPHSHTPNSGVTSAYLHNYHCYSLAPDTK